MHRALTSSVDGLFFWGGGVTDHVNSNQDANGEPRRQVKCWHWLKTR